MIPLETCCLGKVLRRPCKFWSKNATWKKWIMLLSNLKWMKFFTFSFIVWYNYFRLSSFLKDISLNYKNVHITSTSNGFLKYGLGQKIYKWDILSCILILVLCFSYLAYSYWDVKSVSTFPYNDLFGLARSFSRYLIWKDKCIIIVFSQNFCRLSNYTCPIFSKSFSFSFMISYEIFINIW